MHIQSISATIPRETLASFLREARFPEGIALTDFVLGEGAIVLVLKIASYFGIPVRVSWSSTPSTAQGSYSRQRHLSGFQRKASSTWHRTMNLRQSPAASTH